MQTFLPFPDFHESAACLDMRRLGKQRVEAMQILRTITGLSSGWACIRLLPCGVAIRKPCASYGYAVCEE